MMRSCRRWAATRESLVLGYLQSIAAAIRKWGIPRSGMPRFPSLLFVENYCGGYRFAVGVSPLGSLRHRLAVSRNDVLTRHLVFPTGLLNFKARRIRIDSLDLEYVECQAGGRIFLAIVF